MFDLPAGLAQPVYPNPQQPKEQNQFKEFLDAGGSADFLDYVLGVGGILSEVQYLEEEVNKKEMELATLKEQLVGARATLAPINAKLQETFSPPQEQAMALVARKNNEPTTDGRQAVMDFLQSLPDEAKLALAQSMRPAQSAQPSTVVQVTRSVQMVPNHSGFASMFNEQRY